MSSDPVDREVATSLAGGDRARAANVAVQAHGSDLYGFLVSVLDSRAAVPAYRSTVEAIALEIREEAVAWPLVVWLYAMARRAAAAHRDPTGPTAPLTGSGEAGWGSEPPASGRTQTREFRRSAARLRHELTLDQRVLLVLRIARGLTWQQIALVRFCERPSRTVQAARARALRSEFQVLRNSLKIQAMARGILPTA